ncbi:High affinity cGMP-specific 3',5'-cyclic phosphodiesterase 9A [Armadillidium vulgare]|nr:High affinity cGMP-specific 3',5'-cyclic phosphodiesterase 9A [Armadillidium vulgare]
MGHSDEPLDASIHPYWRHVKYRRKVEEEYVEVVSKFNDIWYVDLGLTKTFNIDMEVLRSFLCNVYLNYNQVPFHNFRHAFSVAQMTELALRYNDISPLENHHCAVAFSVLEKNYCNILRELNVQDYKIAREGIIRCVLATDMARHNEILSEFRDIVDEFDFDNKSHINLVSTSPVDKKK